MDPTILSALPTDSLYKFLALAGLLIFLFSLVGPPYFRMKQHFRGLDIEQAKEALNAEELLRGGISEVLNKRMDAELPNGDLWRDIHQHTRDVMDQVRRSDALDAAKLQNEYFPQKLLKWVQGIGATVGAIATVFGFTLWYVQVQQYTDQIQRLQLRQAQLQVAKAEREEREAATPPGPSVDVSSAVPEGAPGAGGVQVGESP